MMEVKSEYKKSELGEIPVNWEIKELKNISDIVTGSTPKTNNLSLWEGEYMFVTPSDMKSQQYMYDTERHVTDEALKLSRTIPKKSIMVTCIASIGKMAIATQECVTNQQINAITPSPEYNSEYLYYYMFKSKSKLKLLASQTTVPIINKSTFSKFKIVLPPLKEQQKIAEILSTVDEQIEQTDQLIEKTKELKKGLMQQLLTKGIGHTEFKQTELGEIPGEWNLLRLQEVLKVMYGKSQTKVEVEESDIPILGTGGIMGWSKEPLYSKKSVLIGRKGTIDKPVYIEKPFWTIDTLFYTDIETTKADVKFIYYLFQSIDWYRYNEATGVPSLSSKNILNILFACPPLKEQKRIASILSSVDEDVEGYQQEKLKFEELKKGLMQQLLTGKTRVKVD